MSEIENKYQERLDDQPEWVFDLCREFTERTSEKIQARFKSDFVESVKQGVDLNDVRVPLLLFMQRRNRSRVEELEIDEDLKQQVSDAIEGVIELLESGTATEAEWTAAAEEVWAVVVDAEAAEARAEAAAARSAVCATNPTPVFWATARSLAWAAQSAGEAARSVSEAMKTAGSAEWAIIEPVKWAAAREAECDAITAEFLRLASELSAEVSDE